MPRFAKILEHVDDPLWRRRLYAFERIFDRLLPLGGMSEGNLIDVFTEGELILNEMLSAISNAQQRIWLETYIFEPDSIGKQFKEALCQAALRGIEVIIIYDAFGSSHLNYTFLEPMRQAGIQTFPFNPIWPWRKKGPLLFRNHRKIMIIDDDLSFCGSMNLCLNPSMRFRESVMKIRGPATYDLANVFLDSLYETTGQSSENKRPIKPYAKGAVAQVLVSNQRRKLVSIQNSMELTLRRAQHSAYFTTPYFLPYDNLRKTILEVAERGIDVRVLTAGLSDVPLMRLASHHVYEQFLKAGIRIYELFDQTLHAKTACIDGVYAWVGSYNLDHWSARRNLEVNVSVIDPHLASILESHFKSDLKHAREIELPSWKKRSWWQRLRNWFAYQIMRL